MVPNTRCLFDTAAGHFAYSRPKRRGLMRWPGVDGMDAQRGNVADGSLDSGYKAIAGWRTPIQQHVRDTQSTRIEISRVESGGEN